MADETQLESGQSGEQELPTPSFSDQATSSTSSGADELVSKLLPHLEQIIERKVQSTKDKRISEIEKVLGGRSKILAELESEGVSIPKEVRTQMQIRELEERLAQQSPQPAQEVDAGPSSQKAAVNEAVAELKEVGLEVDADAIAIFRGRYKSRAEFDLAVQKHINRKLRPQKPANPADVVQSPATAPASGNTDTAAKIARLNELLRQPTKYRAEIAQLQAELDKVGWK